MELRRFLLEGVSFILLLTVLGTPLSGLKNEAPSLDCSHDYIKTMMCQLTLTSEHQSCTEYSVEIKGFRTKSCTFQEQQDVRGQCNCSVTMILVLYTDLTLTLLKGKPQLNKTVKTEHIVKPVPPTITSVNQSNNGNFLVKWNNNYNRAAANDLLTYVVTYRIKGENEVIEKFPNETQFEISPSDLKSRTTYVVNVKNYMKDFDKMSDISNEEEFTTPISSFVIPLLVIIGLSVVAVIITTVVYCHCVRFKAKWWDNVANPPDSSLLNMVPGEQQLLLPSQTTVSPVCVDPDAGGPQSNCSDTSSSEHNTGSSSLGCTNAASMNIITNVQNAVCKALPQLSMMSSASDSSPTVSLRASGLLLVEKSDVGLQNFPGSSAFDNKAYSTSFNPGSQKLIMNDSSDFQMQSQISCDSGYQPSQGENLGNLCPQPELTSQVYRQQSAELLLPVTSSMQTDFSYLLKTADSAAVSGLSSVSGGIDTSVSCGLASTREAGCENGDESVSHVRNPTEETQDVRIEEAKPCTGGNFLTTDDNYQAFQSLVTQTDNLLTEQNSGERGEQHQLDKYPEEHSTKICRSSQGPALPDFIYAPQSPFRSLLSCGRSEAGITDRDYQSV